MAGEGHQGTGHSTPMWYGHLGVVTLWEFIEHNYPVGFFFLNWGSFPDSQLSPCSFSLKKKKPYKHLLNTSASLLFLLKQ